MFPPGGLKKPGHISDRAFCVLCMSYGKRFGDFNDTDAVIPLSRRIQGGVQ